MTKIRPVLQSEASECGLACLAMVAEAHRLKLDLRDIRRRFPVSSKGTTLEQIVQFANRLNLSCRPLRLELSELPQLALPAILHWDLNHFVVLETVSLKCISILDPAVGRREVPMRSVSRSFTGVALELTPTHQFRAADKSQPVRLSEVTGTVIGLKHSLIQIFAVSLALQVFAVLGPMLNQLVVDEVLAGNDRALLPILIIGFGLSLVVQTLFSIGRSWMMMVLGQSLSLQWGSNLLDHMLRLPTSFFEKRHLGDILSKVSSMGVIQNMLTMRLVAMLIDVLTVGIALMMMFFYSFKLTLITIISVLLYAALRYFSYMPYREAAGERLSLAAKESSHFLESLRAIQAIKLFGFASARLARWQNLRVEVQNRDIRTATMNIGFSSANALIFGLQGLLIFWFGALLIMNSVDFTAPQFTIGMFFAFSAYAAQFTIRSSSLIDFYVDFRMLGLHAERVGDIVLEKPEARVDFERDLSDLSPTIEIRNVNFRYSEAEPWVIKDACLKIEAGESVALIGASGSGKTTLLKIIIGIIQPLSGEVLYGGRPIDQLGLENYRRLVGTVMQEDHLLAGSIAENICFFDDKQCMDRISRCLQLAAIEDEILEMPMALHTLVGDMGSSLSGGQKQRILLARALYKRPRALALDEATSHLDIANEKLVCSALASLNLTRIVVAHRPETVANAQRVFELSRGTLRETLTCGDRAQRIN